MNGKAGVRNAASPAAGADPRAILTALSSVVYHWDIESDRIAWGDNAAAVLGVENIDRFSDGQTWRKLLSSRSAGSRDEAIMAGAGVDKGDGVEFQTRYEVILPRGAIAIEDHGRWFAGVDGRPALAHGMIRLTSGEAMSAVHDVGAGARAELLRCIDRAIAATRQHGRPFALLTGCLRDYRAVETRHGSEDASALVTEALARLQRGVRHADALIRYGSNSFALVLARCPKSELESAAMRLSAMACDRPVEAGTGRFSVSMSWGVVADLDGAADAREVLRRAEDAMQHALARGLIFALHTPDRRRDVRRVTEQAVVERVVGALNDRRILIARQPIVEAATRKPRFDEALVRMRGEEGDIIGAGAIVPLFEKLGRIELLDHRVLELAIDALARDPDVSLSINVSTTTLLRDHWLNTLSAAVLGRADIADRMIVELTESQAITDLEATRKIFSKLKAMGLRTAIDDFGAGYTSFKHLRGLDVDILKIDGAFVQNIGSSADDSFFVRTLIDLARHLNMETVAEWVRDEDAARKLAAWGVTYLQGEAIAPARIAEAERKVARAA